jgi:hypothetical protein
LTFRQNRRIPEGGRKFFANRFSKGKVNVKKSELTTTLRTPAAKKLKYGSGTTANVALEVQAERQRFIEGLQVLSNTAQHGSSVT